MVNLPTVEDYEVLKNEIHELKAMIALVANSTCAPKVVTVMDICSFEGISKTQISKKEVYLLPNFGVSEYPEGTKRWNFETFMNWRSIPVKQRKEMYCQYLENQRLAYVRARNMKKG